MVDGMMRALEKNVYYQNICRKEIFSEQNLLADWIRDVSKFISRIRNCSKTNYKSKE